MTLYNYIIISLITLLISKIIQLCVEEKQENVHSVNHHEEKDVSEDAHQQASKSPEVE